MRLNPDAKRSTLSIRLSKTELERIDQAAVGQGVNRTDLVRALLLQANLPKPRKVQVADGGNETARSLIDVVNRASKQLERTADFLEASATIEKINDSSIDRAAWQLSAVDAALREALKIDSKD